MNIFVNSALTVLGVVFFVAGLFVLCGGFIIVFYAAIAVINKVMRKFL